METRTGRRRRRRRKTSKFRIFIVFVLIILFARFGTSAFFKRNQIDHVIQLKRAGNPIKDNPYKRPIRILLLGSDSRTHIVEGSHSDAIIVIQINTDHSAQMVSFPRDSYVEVTGYGEKKINSAFAIDGPDLAVQTIEDYSGLKIDYYLVTTFPGFHGLINSFGGLKINVDSSIHDPYSGANLDEGFQKLKAGQALALARARHNVENGDWTRADHQQDIIEAAFLQVRKYRGDFMAKSRIAVKLNSEIETDLSILELRRLVSNLLAVDPNKISKLVLKGKDSSIDGASVVLLDDEFAEKTFEKMKDKNRH